MAGLGSACCGASLAFLARQSTFMRLPEYWARLAVVVPCSRSRAGFVAMVCKLKVSLELQAPRKGKASHIIIQYC